MTDFTAAGMAAFLIGLEAKIKEEEHRALERAARIVKAEAKREIGTYQEAAGPFAAWPELAEATKADRVAHGFPKNEPLLRTGEMRDSIEHSVVGNEAHVGSDSQVAVWQELGTSKMPPRSFLGGAAVRKTNEVVRIVGEGMVAVLSGRSNSSPVKITGD